MWTDASSDDELVVAVLGGESQAFSVVVRRHHTRLKVLVYGMLREAAATEDVLQDTYLKAFRSLGWYRQDGELSAWMHRIAYNAVLDHKRRHARITPADPQTFDGGASRSIEHEAVDRLHVLEALAPLSDLRRAIVLLVDGHGFDYTTAASLLDISRDALAAHLHVSRKIVRSHLRHAEEDK